jgi:hypothetical protein
VAPLRSSALRYLDRDVLDRGLPALRTSSATPMLAERLFAGPSYRNS